MPYFLIIIGVLAMGAYGFGKTYVDNYMHLSAKVEEQRRDLELRDGREASFRRMIDRRDAAIKASKCSAQIDRWVNNPDEIPKPFKIPNSISDSVGGRYGP